MKDGNSRLNLDVAFAPSGAKRNVLSNAAEAPFKSGQNLPRDSLSAIHSQLQGSQVCLVPE